MTAQQQPMPDAENAARAKMLVELVSPECVPQARDAYEFLFVKDWNEMAAAFVPRRVGMEPHRPTDGTQSDTWERWRADAWHARRENVTRLATCVWALNVVRRLGEREAEGTEGGLLTMRGKIGRFLRDEWRVNEDPPRALVEAERWAEAHVDAMMRRWRT